MTASVPIQLLIGDEDFPDPRFADPSGIVALGGELTVDRLLAGYRRGIFPWYSDSMPVLWHCPDPRMVLRCEALRVNRSLAKQVRRAPYRLTLDRCFDRVIAACARIPRPGQDGTWITDDMMRAYCGLHRMGLAHSIEAWDGDELVGGLYGVSMGQMFFGESMFALRPNASKIAFVRIVQQLLAWGIDLIDCQVYTEHLDRFGGEEWSRSRFLNELAARLDGATRRGPWTFDQAILEGPVRSTPAL